MNKTVIIIGSIALLGVGAFLYFKPKAKVLTGANGTGTAGAGTTGTGEAGSTMPPAGTVFTTPEEVEAITVKVSTARDLTNLICDLKKRYKITQDQMNDFMNIVGTAFGSASNVTQNFGTPVSSLGSVFSTTQTLAEYALARKKAIQTVADSITKLKELGYKEVDCKMVKIV